MKKLILSLIGAASCVMATATDYKLVTSADQLEVGKSYIVAGKEDAVTYVMGQPNTNNRNFTRVQTTASGNTISITDENPTLLKLENSGNAEFGYCFTYVKAGSTVWLAAYSSSNNYLGSIAELNEGGNAKIEISDATGAATVTFNQQSTKAATKGNYYTIRYNANNGIFAAYATGQDDIYLYKEVTEVASVADPVLSVEGGNYTEPQSVAITCETEGAEIYYTLDGSTPDNSSTLYTAPIAINTTTTLKAVAVKDGASSDVVTATYNILKTYTSMFDMLGEVALPAENKGNSETFFVGFEPVVAYVNGANVYITDGIMYSLVFKYNTGLVAGDKIKAGWAAHVTNFNGLYEIVPEGNIEADGTADIPVPAEVMNMTSLTKDFVNSIMIFPETKFEEATPADAANFNGLLGNETVPFRNTFKVESVEPGVYNVKAAVSIYMENLQMLPIEYTQCVTATPTFSVAEGEVPEGTEVAISCATVGARIYYTLDGTEPTVESTEYVEPIVINEATVITAIAVAEGYINSVMVTARYEIEPIVIGGDPYYVLPSAETDYTVIPTTFFPWWQCAGISENKQEYANLKAANVYTFKVDETIIVEAASGGWLSTGFDVSPILKGDYDLVFSIKSTSAAKTAIKLVPEGQEDKGNETQFTYDNNGEWQTVRMNLREQFPNFAASGATTNNVYVFSFVAGEGMKAGDTYDLTDVCFVPKGEDRPTYEAPVPAPEVPETLYLIGHVDGTGFSPVESLEMEKADNTFTITATVDDSNNGVGYFAFTTVQSNDWQVVNANRWGAASHDEAVELGEATVLTKGEHSFMIPVGSYIFKVVYGDTDIVMTVNKVSGVTDIDSADMAETEYYNLQGMRVANPANGVYLMKRGNTVSKVYVK